MVKIALNLGSTPATTQPFTRAVYFIEWQPIEGSEYVCSQVEHLTQKDAAKQAAEWMQTLTRNGFFVSIRITHKWVQS
jgi:hypothetical protein